MHKWQLFITVTVLFTLVFSTTAHAQLPQISSGLSYLSSSQNPDGTWGAGTSLVETTATTISALETLKLLNQTGGTAYSTGVTWLQGQTLQGVDPIAGRIRVLALANGNADALMPSLDQLKGAWGGDEDYTINILDTNLALQALKAANYADQTTITSALNYLTSTQNLDGGWGFVAGDDSSIHVTALVSRTIQQFAQTTLLATSLNKATSYLLVRQNSDGGFGSPSSTIHETALAYTAVVAVITDATVLGKAVGFLTTNQSADGSWLQDPYSTALALRALHYSENKPTPPPLPPTTGTLNGKVVSAATSEPLAGVTVSLAGNPTIIASTDSAGAFRLANIPQGSQQILFALSGYASGNLTTTVLAGSIVNLGTLTLAVASPTGIVQGVITDAATGSPIAGVVITVTGTATWTAVTTADGAFKIVDVIPGIITLSTSKAGYAAINGTGTISAGGVMMFSPALSITQSSGATGELKGMMVDKISSVPIAGAVVSITGTKSYTTSTNATGQYSLTNIDPGSYFISITAAGYYAWGSNSLITIVAGGVTDLVTQMLELTPASTSISGQVTDSLTNVPIADAEVFVTGTTLKAKTDATGAYTIQGINLLGFELKASATGYDSKSYNIYNQYHGIYMVDFSLAASPVKVGIVSVTTGKEIYQAYADVTVTAEILNSDILPVTATINASILNAQGEVVTNLQATAPNADGVLLPSITFQPGIIRTVSIPWNTGYLPPGAYSIIVKIMEDASVTGLESMVIAQQSHKITIEPTQAIASLTLTPFPRYTNLGATEQIGLQAAFVNRSNIPTEVVFSYDWKSPDGVVLHSGTGTITALPTETSKSILLESFPFTFTKSGEHPSQVKITSGPMPASLVGGVVTVAPGIRIEPSQSLTPTTLIPDGDKRIRLNIRLKGVETK